MAKPENGRAELLAEPFGIEVLADESRVERDDQLRHDPRLVVRREVGYRFRPADVLDPLEALECGKRVALGPNEEDVTLPEQDVLTGGNGTISVANDLDDVNVRAEPRGRIADGFAGQRGAGNHRDLGDVVADLVLL
jgi:hypothetical protein